jgi:hypothetical protein
MEAERQRLARWIAGVETPDPGWIADDRIDAVLALAREEGVVCLLDHGLRGQNPVFRDAAREETLRSMMLEGETRRVLAALAALGIPGLLLKGSALAHWAYPLPHLRACNDVDILVPSREAAEQLAAALVAQGYSRATPSGDLVAHELMCTRRMTPQWLLEVDVHWRLHNTTLFAQLFGFDELMASSIAVPRLAPNARGLGPVDALLHAAVHRARNLANGTGDALKWLYDLVVLTQAFGASEWTALVEQARRKQLAGMTLSALDAAGQAFALEVPATVRGDLREAATAETLDVDRLGDWRYMQLQNFRSVRGLAPRLRWLWQRLFPSGDYMRTLYGLHQAGYPALLRERLRRLGRKWRQL